MKKLNCILMAFALMFSAGISASAYSGENTASPYYLYTYSVNTAFKISGGTATCTGTITGNSTVTKIVATLYLEKKDGDSWKVVNGAVWSGSVSGNSLSMAKTKDYLGSGTYRARIVGTVYSGSKSEPVEKTSSEVTV